MKVRGVWRFNKNLCKQLINFKVFWEGSRLLPDKPATCQSDQNWTISMKGKGSSSVLIMLLNIFNVLLKLKRTAASFRMLYWELWQPWNFSCLLQNLLSDYITLKSFSKETFHCKFLCNLSLRHDEDYTFFTLICFYGLIFINQS